MNSILTPFPQLLTYGIFAPTLLRIAVAILFAWLAYKHYQRREQIGNTNFPIFGKGVWIAWLAVIVEAATAAALFFGYYTQYAAIVGILMSLKNAVWAGKYPSFFMLSRSSALLVLVICLSLLVTGAGIFAFDLPL
jgi:uncharacterized membrane protein YphA (DoxX/SURF4 family)